MPVVEQSPTSNDRACRPPLDDECCTPVPTPLLTATLLPKRPPDARQPLTGGFGATLVRAAPRWAPQHSGQEAGESLANERYRGLYGGPPGQQLAPAPDPLPDIRDAR